MFKRENFVGTIKLLKFGLRRDRLKLILWTIIMSLMVIAFVAGNAEIEVNERVNMAVSAIQSPGMRLILAPIRAEALEDLSAFFFMRMSFLFSIIFALLISKMVVRHSRDNEDTGCAELIGSKVTGRYALITSSVLIALFASVLYGFGMTIGLLASGFEVGSSFLAGVSYAFLGVFFVGVSSVSSQLSGSSKGANGISTIVLAVIFMINALGNVMGEVHSGGLGYTSHTMVWASPIGWVQQMFIYDLNKVWPLVLFIGMFFVLLSFAYYLVNLRDVGRGILAARRGNANAKKWMQNPYGMTLRLNIGHFTAWAIALFVIGLIFGAASDSFGESIEGVEFIEDVLKASATAFRFMLINVIASVVLIYALQSTLRLKQEETGGALESILAQPVKRSTITTAQILVSFIGSFLLVMLFSLAIGIGSFDTIEDFGKILLSGFYQSMGVLSISGLIVLIYAYFPKKVFLISWILVITTLVLGPFIGAITQLPESILNLSVFTHLSIMPDDISFLSLVILALIGLLGTVLGIEAFKHRNLELQ